MTCTPSSNWSKRSFSGGRRIPRASDSSWFQPAPRPMISRPSLMTSMVAAMLASTDGWRYGMPVTWHPRRSREVAAAIAASIDQPSRQGPERSEKIGSKWSKFQADSNMSSWSPARQTSSIADQVVFIGAVLKP